jgi:hypothetical protein
VRFFHAISYTFVDRTDSGRRTLAFSNFAGAAGGGFVGMAYLPDGFNDVTHAEQRTLTEFMALGISNILGEFAPQLAPIVHNLHIPQILPAWWVPAFDKAITKRKPPAGLVRLSNRGVQYASDDYVKILSRHEMIPSMSRSGNRYDNASCEAP